MVSINDAVNTVEKDNSYIILPNSDYNKLNVNSYLKKYKKSDNANSFKERLQQRIPANRINERRATENISHGQTPCCLLCAVC